MAELDNAVSLVLSRTSVRPRVGLILGSGLGSVAAGIHQSDSISYAEIPGFACPTVPGHQGELEVGILEDIPVAVMKGRVHYYEGFSPAQVGFPVRLLRALGVETLIITNAAGGLNPDLKPGTLMVLEDHINLPGLGGLSALVGVAGDGERFVDMVGAYDAPLRRIALEVAQERGIQSAGGVYVMVAGPSYETPAEARFLRNMGADAVGMSTASEVVVARWLGMRVLAISCITNALFGPAFGEVEGHAGVVSVAQAAASDLAFLLRGILSRLRE